VERWRRRALEAFPELQQELTGADDSIASQALFLVELHEMGLAAAYEGNTDFVRRVSDYIEWLDQVPVLRVAEPEPEYKPFPTEGFLVVRSGEAHIWQYVGETAKTCVNVPPDETLETVLNGFWAALGVNPAAYRGMGRVCLFAWVDETAAWLGERAGRLRLRELIGDDLYLEEDSEGFLHSSSNSTLLASVEEAEEVRLLLDTPTDWETIGISKLTSTRNTRTLGFDIGWWADEHYSLISDCIVAPIFHGPYDEDLPEVASQASTLNQHLLFDTVESAVQFRDWYRTKPWAETENGAPFIVVRIDSAS
jgi:hypothetical protein